VNYICFKEAILMSYELIMLLIAELSEEKIDAIINKYETYINKQNGEFIGAEKWGKRYLQGNICKKKRISEAYYVLINFTDNKHKLKELDYKLRIDDEIIRHMISKSVRKEEEVVAA